jgi:hypothetical protein
MSIQFGQGDRSKKRRAEKCAQNLMQQILRHLSPLTLYLYVEITQKQSFQIQYCSEDRNWSLGPGRQNDRIRYILTFT